MRARPPAHGRGCTTAHAVRRFPRVVRPMPLNAPRCCAHPSARPRGGSLILGGHERGRAQGRSTGGTAAAAAQVVWANLLMTRGRTAHDGWDLTAVLGV